MIENQIRKPPKIFLFLAYSFIFFSIFILKGYIYPHGNHSQEVPPILALMDSSLFTKDFSVQSYLGEGPRKYYQLIVFALSKTGLSLETIYITLFAFSLISVILAIFKIAKLNSSKIWVNSWSSGLILLGWFIFGAKGWGSHLFLGVPIPSTFAMGIVIWGVYFTLRGKALIGYIFFGLGGIIQFLVGFMAGLSFIPAVLLMSGPKTNTFNLRRILIDKLLPFLAWSLLLLVIYLPMYFQDKMMPPYDSTFSITFLFGNIRVPHHWLPSFASINTWINNIAFYAGAALLGLRSKDKFNKRIVISMILTMVICLMGIVVNYLFVEIYPIEVIGKLQFQRILPFSHLAAYILLIGSINQMALEKPFPLWKIIFFITMPLTRFYGLAVFTGALLQPVLERYSNIVYSKSKIETLIYGLLTILFLVIRNYYNSKEWKWIAYSDFKVAAFIFVALCIMISISSFKLWETRSNLQIIYFMAPLSLTIFISLILLSNTNKTIIGDFSRLFIQTSRPQLETDKYKIAKLFQNKSKKDDLILIPPLKGFQFFAYDSVRPVVFSWKNVPFKDSSIQEWGRRLREITGVEPYKAMRDDEELEKLYCGRSKEQLIEVAKKYNAEFTLFDSRCHGVSESVNNNSVVESGPYYIEKVP